MNDYLEVCVSDISGHGPKDYPAFKETFCKRCRNRDCQHAKWADDKFSARVNTQVDRFFNNPNRADQGAPQYAQIPDFANMLREAIRLEAADRRGDWSVPEEPRERPSITVVDPNPTPDLSLSPVPEKPARIILPPSVQGNTPRREGIVLPGGPTKESLQEPVDPWAAPKVKTVMVEKGAVVKMGGQKDE